jgi:hypothetical protein
MSLHRLALITLVAFAVVPPAAAQRADRLKPFVSRAGKFRVKFSKEPRTETKELSLGAGGRAVPVTTERVNESRDTVFAVTFADYPESYREVPLNTVLDGVRRGLKGIDGTIEKDEEVVLGEGPDRLFGREIWVKAGRRAVRARVFLKGTRLYQVMVTGYRESLRDRDVSGFLNSFELVK